MTSRAAYPAKMAAEADLMRARIRNYTTATAVNNVQTQPNTNGEEMRQDVKKLHNHPHTNVVQSISAAPFGDDKAAGAGAGYMDATEHNTGALRHRKSSAPTEGAEINEAAYRRRGSYPFKPVVYPTHWDPESIQRVTVTDWSAAIGNPSPFGLYCFSVTTMIFGFINIGVGPTPGFIMLGMNWAIVHAGLGQVLAGIYELNRGQTFAGTTFTTFGLFWLGLGMYYLMVILGVIPPEETVVRWPVRFLASYDMV
ncbi:hypothetical protein HDU93_009977 [Gonapodya sp. JEL0774]|nr:hypothetical protein HDU93_009977 [Gonapodya sp. JEL0774]